MRQRTHSNSDIVHTRTRFLLIAFILAFFLITLRLFFWQIVQRTSLQAAAEDQYQREVITQGKRGNILTSDGKILVTNKEVYRLFAQPHLIENKEKTAQILSEQLASVDPNITLASMSASKATIYSQILSKIETDKKWISLLDNVSEETKNKIAEQKLPGVGFDAYLRRTYPEASMAAHITGFVGKNEAGFDTGYFGIEGALEKELASRRESKLVATDALGQQLLNDPNVFPNSLNGRDITTTIRRDMQHLSETALKDGIDKYGAKSGEIIIMEPKTGKIRAIATYPNYAQEQFFSFPAQVYKNPSVTDIYEPGSTFKVLTVAAGLDSKKITPDTQCPSCAGPRQFGKYTIKTWNDKYIPNITMTEALAKSDNTAMIYIAEQMGKDVFREYLGKFGIGEELHLDLQEDTSTPIPQNWGPVELATTSFGQGIGTTSLQLVRAISAVANGGVMMRPRIVETVTDNRTGEKIAMEPVIERRVISEEAARLTTQMMIASADAGEAQWVKSRTHTIAAKTGTSQIAVNGSYDPDKTIASYVGFAPPDNPQFIMLVKLVEPESSIWAAETAAPLWYSVADKLFVMLKLAPDREIQ